ncbi:hypothetical protein [Novosphingobium naphthalenivorans]|uniref:hypothetical protein n=1 Tax=Novosphingobium naphthalenivorans TaxID=273168 RepID=UPI000830E127|nr:hypothetical protein [Novosphingobium naphthalenivorans]
MCENADLSAIRDNGDKIQSQMKRIQYLTESIYELSEHLEVDLPPDGLRTLGHMLTFIDIINETAKAAFGLADPVAKVGFASVKSAG